MSAVANDSIDPDAMLRRAIEHPLRWKVGTYRWVAVQEIFYTGSTTSIRLCERYGFNPHELKQRRK